MVHGANLNVLAGAGALHAFGDNACEECQLAPCLITSSASAKRFMGAQSRCVLEMQDLMQLVPLADTGTKADLGRPLLSAGLCFDFHKVRAHAGASRVLVPS